MALSQIQITKQQVRLIMKLIQFFMLQHLLLHVFY